VCGAVTPDEFRQAGHQLIDWIADYVEGIERYPVNPDVKPGDVRAALSDAPPAAPESWEAVRADVERVVVPGIVHWQHPSFFAYFPSNTTYPSILGELLATGLGVQGMSWVTSPACTELETLMLDWMVQLLALPERFVSTSGGGGGVIQGSASEATLVAICSARWRATAGAVNADGDTTRLVAYATAQTHSSVEKGLRIAGIGTERLRIVAHDASFTMRPDALAEAIAADRAAGLVPFFVCATHGTTSSMAFDPTPEIGPLCRSNAVWLHVDAAMSGIAALAPEHRWVNEGLEHADSYCTNPHKWMGVNFDCDLYWTSDRVALLGALSILPEYLRSAAAETGAAIDYRGLAGPARPAVPCAQAVADDPPRGSRCDPGDDPPARRAHPTPRCRGGRRRAVRDRCAAPTEPAVHPARRRRRRHGPVDRGGERDGVGPVHPHRARRPLRAPLLHRHSEHRVAARRRGLAAAPVPGLNHPSV
jgi:aromatic-L-amino-acid decarboxylase